MEWKFRFQILRQLIGQLFGSQSFRGKDEDGAKVGKYINSPDSPVYNKGQMLFGLYEARKAMRKAGFALVVEGNVDVVALSQAGFENVIAPMGTGQRHGHMNSAIFYCLRGKGYDIHDGKRFDYEAGDVMVVENGCVHQHFNASETEDLVLLVMKASKMKHSKTSF